MPPLHQTLRDTDPPRLRAIAQFWDVTLTQNQPREMARELAEAMISAEALEAALKRLTEEQRRALETLAASGGVMPQRVFSRDWGEIRAMGPGRMDRERPWEDPVSPAEALWYSGFLFKVFDKGPEGTYEAVSIPPELRDLLPHIGESERAGSLEPIPRPSVVHFDGEDLLEDACTLLAYVQTQKPSINPAGVWREDHARRLQSRLLDQRADRFAFLCHLASHIGWVVGEDAGRASLQPEAVTSWLKSTSSQQRLVMSECWEEDTSWNDLFHVPSLQPVDTGVWRNEPLLARRAILGHLKVCVPNHWYKIESFIALIKEVDPDFQRPSGDYKTWYIRDEVTGRYLSGFESWNAIEGRLIRYVLTGPMRWLGLVKLGADAGGHSPRAFRLSDAGSAFVGLATLRPPSEPPAPLLRPGFEVTVPVGRRYERFQIARVTDWLQSGDPFVYRLTPSSLERARRQRIPIERVLAFLDEVTEAPLPGRVKEALNRWDRQGIEASLQQGMVLRLADEELMDRAITTPKLRRLVEERVGPTAALVKHEDWHRVITALEEMGLLPDTRDLPN
jgi:hypothetical protein